MQSQEEEIKLRLKNMTCPVVAVCRLPKLKKSSRHKAVRLPHGRLFLSTATLTLLLLQSCSTDTKSTDSEKELVNFKHLDHLSEWVQMGGDSVLVVRIYSEYPGYEWVEAKGEGIACVDDAARAAVAYLRYYEFFGDSSVLRPAKGLLRFLLQMQTEDGEYYNFVDANLDINRLGRTSKRAFGCPAARAYWAMGYGYRMFIGADPGFARVLKDAFLRCKRPISILLREYGRFVEFHGSRYPGWLIYGTAADATSELLIGLAEFLKIEEDAEISLAAGKLAEGLLAMQLDSSDVFPGVFLSWRDTWHAWGNAQSQALASLGGVLGDSVLVAAAEREARQFYGRLLVEGWMREFDLRNPEHRVLFPQIAYDVRCVTLGLLRLYEVTHDDDYAKMAGLAASWFFGNNSAETAMYDPATGRCFDGIEDSSKVNLNSGAESTTEALYALIEVVANPIAREYLEFVTVEVGHYRDSRTSGKTSFRILSIGKKTIALVFDQSSLDFRILEGDEVEKLRQQHVLSSP